MKNILKSLPASVYIVWVGLFIILSNFLLTKTESPVLYLLYFFFLIVVFLFFIIVKSVDIYNNPDNTKDMFFLGLVILFFEILLVKLADYFFTTLLCFINLFIAFVFGLILIAVKANIPDKPQNLFRRLYGICILSFLVFLGYVFLTSDAMLYSSIRFLIGSSFVLFLILWKFSFDIHLPKASSREQQVLKVLFLVLIVILFVFYLFIVLRYSAIDGQKNKISFGIVQPNVYYNKTSRVVYGYFTVVNTGDFRISGCDVGLSYANITPFRGGFGAVYVQLYNENMEPFSYYSYNEIDVGESKKFYFMEKDQQTLPEPVSDIFLPFNASEIERVDKIYIQCLGRQHFNIAIGRSFTSQNDHQSYIDRVDIKYVE